MFHSEYQSYCNKTVQKWNKSRHVQLVVKSSRLRIIAHRPSIYQNVPCDIFYPLYGQLFLSKFIVNCISSNWNGSNDNVTLLRTLGYSMNQNLLHRIDFELAVSMVLSKFLDLRSFWRYRYHQLLLRGKIRSSSCLATRQIAVATVLSIAVA